MQSSLTDQLSIKFFPEVYMSQFERGGVVDSKWVQREEERESPAVRSTSMSSHVIPSIHLPTRDLATMQNLTSDELPQVPIIPGKIGLVPQEVTELPKYF